MRKDYSEPKMKVQFLSDAIVMSAGSFGSGDDYVTDETPMFEN